MRYTTDFSTTDVLCLTGLLLIDLLFPVGIVPRALAFTFSRPVAC